MAKEVLIECPKCGRINNVKVGFFHSTRVHCHCGSVINVNNERMVTKQCPKCGNIVTYDRVKNEYPLCPICHEPLKEEREDWKFVEIVCDDCSSHLIVNKDDEETECPICSHKINIKKAIELQKFKSENQPLLLKCDLNSDVVAIRHKLEDFPIFSQILVDESQKAVFISNGKVVGSYEAGNHRVDFNNEVLSKENAFKSEVSFKSKLYFVSTNIFSNNKWGTDSKIKFLDPLSNMHIELGAHGIFNFKISDVSKFLFDYVGLSNVTLEGYRKDDLLEKLKPIVIGEIKSLFPKVLKTLNVNVLEIDENLSTISTTIKESINKEIDKFGITLTDFVILNVLTPDDDPNFKKLVSQYAEKYLKVKDENIKEEEAKAAYSRKMTEAKTENELALEKAKVEAEITKIKAQAEAEAYYLKAHAEANEMKEKGYSYKDETNRNVSSQIAKNFNNGAFSPLNNNGGGNEFSHLAAESVKANLIKNIGKSLSNEILEGICDTKVDNETDAWICPSCNRENPSSSNFCPNCGNKKPE